MRHSLLLENILIEILFCVKESYESIALILPSSFIVTVKIRMCSFLSWKL